MDVRRQRAAKGESVRTCLLLHNGPLKILLRLFLVEILNQLRPLDSSFHVNQSALAIEAQYVVEAAGIHQQRAIGKLLATHGVPATSNRECFACLPRSANDAAAFID